MERVRELIDKLWKQHQQQEGPEHLLDTVQQLQELLSGMVRKEQLRSAGKVAIVLPPKRRTTTVAVSAPPRPAPAEPAPAVPDGAAAAPVPEAPQTPEPAVAPVQPVETTVAPIPEADQPYLPKLQEVPAAPPEGAPENKETRQSEELAKVPYQLHKPLFAVKEPPVAAPNPVPEPAPVAAPLPPAAPKTEEREVFHLHFDTTDEAPTLTQQFAQQPRELHEMIGEQKESLNDRLKQDRPELASKLKDTPIKDLRKAIGVNDKFLFIKELFRGDEAMYERSIKTINNFHILPEAEYWISRELKVKLGWDDSSNTVQLFYQLVKRRFV